MDGPLFDDWFVALSLTPPHYPGGGIVAVIRWNEPGPLPDQRRVQEFEPVLDHTDIAGAAAELIEAYLTSRASGIRRVISSLERRRWLRL